MKCLYLLASTQPANQETNFAFELERRIKSAIKQSIEKLFYLVFLFVYNLFSKIVWGNNFPFLVRLRHLGVIFSKSTFLHFSLKYRFWQYGQYSWKSFIFFD